MSWRAFWRNQLESVMVRYRGPGRYPFNLQDMQQMDRLGRGPHDFRDWLHLRDLQYSRRGSVPWAEQSYDRLFNHFVSRPIKQTALGLSGAAAAGALSYASMLTVPKVPKPASYRKKILDDDIIMAQASRHRGRYRDSGRYRLGPDGSVLSPYESARERYVAPDSIITSDNVRYDYDIVHGDIHSERFTVPPKSTSHSRDTLDDDFVLPSKIDLSRPMHAVLRSQTYVPQTPLDVDDVPHNRMYSMRYIYLNSLYRPFGPIGGSGWTYVQYPDFSNSAKRYFSLYKYAHVTGFEVRLQGKPNVNAQSQTAYVAYVDDGFGISTPVCNLDTHPHLTDWMSQPGAQASTTFVFGGYQTGNMLFDFAWSVPSAREKWGDAIADDNRLDQKYDGTMLSADPKYYVLHFGYQSLDRLNANTPAMDIELVQYVTFYEPRLAIDT